MFNRLLKKRISTNISKCVLWNKIRHDGIIRNDDGRVDNLFLKEHGIFMRTKFLTILILGVIYGTPVFSWAGFDDYSTPHINEGAIGSGFDDYSTPDINEGAIGYDDIHDCIHVNEPGCNEGAW